MLKRKKTNFIKVIGLGLILISTLLTFKYIYEHYKDVQKTEEIIEEFFPDVVPSPIEEEKIEEIPKVEEKKEFVLTNNYLGYIEFSNYGIKRLIVNGTDKKVLDKSLVGVYNTSANLDDEFGNVILAGHNNNNVFAKLHYMKVNDPIKIVTHNNTYDYVVKEKHSIKDNDYSYFKQVKDKKILTLVTCQNNNKERHIVVAELRG